MTGEQIITHAKLQPTGKIKKKIGGVGAKSLFHSYRRGEKGFSKFSARGTNANGCNLPLASFKTVTVQQLEGGRGDLTAVSILNLFLKKINKF